MTSPCDDEFEFHALAECPNYRKWILAQFVDVLGAASNTIEIGAGIGQFTETVLAVQPKVTMLEPCEAYAARLPCSDSLRAFTGTVPSFLSEYPGEVFSSAISVNVLEHIEHDLDELKSWRHLLEEGGAVCLLVPASQRIYAPIDAKMGHHRRYSKSDLRKKLETADFEVLTCRYFNFLGYFIWWMNFKLLKKDRFSPSAARIFDRWVLPLAKILDAAGLTAICGQSVVAIARKPNPGRNS